MECFFFLFYFSHLFSTLVTRRKTLLYFFLPSSKFTFFFILFKSMPLSTLLILATCVSYINFLRVAQLAIKSLCCLLVQEHIKSLQITLVNVISLWIFHILVCYINHTNYCIEYMQASSPGSWSEFLFINYISQFNHKFFLPPP